jgi:hypothetical protein
MARRSISSISSFERAMKRQSFEVAPSRAKPSETTSSETASSETTWTDGVWRRFALAYLGVFAGVVGVVYVFIIAVDPYDSGRFPALRLLDGLQRNGKADDAARSDAARSDAARSDAAGFGDTDTSQRTGNVALGRSARFNAAIFGNSHGQLLSPQRLSQATGLDFVQLTVPGANVREQLAMLGWFMHHHAEARALVLALDERWCVTDPALPLRSPFPFWLYSDSNLVYLANALSTRTLRDSFRRLASAGGASASIDGAGYSDYEAGKAWSFTPGKPAPAEGFPARDDRPFRREPDFPGLIRLDGVLAEVPAKTAVVIVLPPQFYTQLPPADTGGARFRDYCKWQIAQRAARGDGSAFLDFLVDSAITRNPENFMDAEHYRTNVAETIEAEIAAALNRRRAAAEGGHD